MFPRERQESRAPERRRRGTGAAAGLVVLMVALGCHRQAARPLRRLLALTTTPPHEVVLDGLRLPVLEPGRDEHVVHLAGAPPPGTLVFSLGVADASPARFTIAVRSATSTDEVYRRDVVESGWTDDHVDLAGTDLHDRDLVFRTARLDGRGGTAAAYWGDPTFLSRDTPPAPAVVLVSLDTLRADRVGLYGGPDAARTPALDALAQSSVVYDQAYAPATWTLPSHRSLLSGRQPPPQPPHDAHDPLFLAETLHDAGYLTAGFTGGGFVSATFGFGRGFDAYYEFRAPPGSGPPDCQPERFDGPAVFHRAIAWLERHGRFPSFLFVHTYDAHDRCPFVRAGIRFAGLNVADRDRIAAHYRSVVERVDGLVASLVSTLDRTGLASTTMLIVTSDHGEGLWEHGYGGHGGDAKPYVELARVPLIVRIPGRSGAGTHVETPVSLVDVGPTILRALGIAPPPGMRGTPLPGLGFDPVGAPGPVLVDGGRSIAVRDGPLVLISTRDADDELYDLAADPEERTARPSDPALATLRREAAAYRDAQASAPAAPRPAAGDEPAVPTETRDRLRALGYLE